MKQPTTSSYAELRALPMTDDARLAIKRCQRMDHTLHAALTVVRWDGKQFYMPDSTENPDRPYGRSEGKKP